MEADGLGEKGYRGLPMEGSVARRYAKLRRSGSQLEDWKRQAARWAAALPEGSRVLEVAPGPGYFAVELARTGRLKVTGLDISRTFVQIARAYARQEGAPATFELGDASRMPFSDSTFDLIVCQAAFKNFRRPRTAIEEMHRVLRPGGTAVIEDMRRDATDAGIRDEVAAMGLGRFGALATRWILRRLRRRAYTREEFGELASGSSFHRCESTTDRIGIEVRFTKPGPTPGPPSAPRIGPSGNPAPLG
jgi:ubiquinone/menaquinone biosynthesis C-methylase UbiE